MSRKSTMFTFLMHGTTTGSSTTWAKLCDIIDYPDLEGTPNSVDATTLSDSAEESVPGVKQGSQYTFTAAYEKTDYEAIRALENTEGDFALWEGATESSGVVTPTGSNGKWTFKGYVTVSKAGGGVDDLSKMNITINRTSEIEFE